MSSRKHSDQPLKAIINEWLNSGGLRKKYNELEVFQAYKELMGPVIARHTSDLKLREKTLIIKINSGALTEELSYSKQKIAQLINEKFGFTVVDHVEVW